MEYIVYIGSVGEYYVSYKDKICDNYSDKWYLAKRYKTLVGAMKRLNINIGDTKTISGLLNRYKHITNSESFKREISINNLLGEETKITTLLSELGRIEKVENNKIICDSQFSQNSTLPFVQTSSPA